MGGCECNCDCCKFWRGERDELRQRVAELEAEIKLYEDSENCIAFAVTDLLVAYGFAADEFCTDDSQDRILIASIKAVTEKAKQQHACEWRKYNSAGYLSYISGCRSDEDPIEMHLLDECPHCGGKVVVK